MTRFIVNDHPVSVCKTCGSLVIDSKLEQHTATHERVAQLERIDRARHEPVTDPANWRTIAAGRGTPPARDEGAP